MKKFNFLFAFVLSQTAFGQITLKECLESGLSQRATIKSVRTEVLLTNLKSIENKGKYLPQVSLAYDFRYNPIIASQIVPVGQFSPVPTDEKRAIQFGTKWQQNAGVSVYQPLLDLAVQSRIKESKLNESLSSVDAKKAETDLAFEITKSYHRVLALSFQVDEGAFDSARSYQSYAMMRAKFNEGKLLKTELNQALLNHYANVTQYKKTMASLITEKIYLHYLTQLPLERLLGENLAAVPASLFATDRTPTPVPFDSVPAYQRLNLQERLLLQQVKTERSRFAPTVGLQGFIGANQFSQTFDSFLSNSWYGNSYVGLTMKLPLFSPDKSVNAGKQLHAQLSIAHHQKEEWVAQQNRAMIQLDVDLQRIDEEIKILDQSVGLQSENIRLYRDRFEGGQYTAMELNRQESELQKLTNQLKSLLEQRSNLRIERLYTSGLLTQRLRELR